MQLTYEPDAIVPMGTYAAIIEKAEESEGKYGPMIWWQFNLGQVRNVDGVDAYKTLSYPTDMKITAKNKLGKLVRGLRIDPTTISDTQDLVGRRCMVNVIVEEGGEFGADGQPIMVNKIQGFAPAAEGSAPVAPQAAPVSTTDIPF